MKKSIIIIAVLVIIGLGVWVVKGNKGPSGLTNATSTPAGDSSVTVGVAATETTKVTEKLSEYKNEELGFAIKYPSTWTAVSSNNGVTFMVPVGKADTSTVKKIESKIIANLGKCTFPPVTTIKERSTVKVGTFSFNMISMSNSVQGNNYFDRMYSLQKDSICYIFSLSAITASPASKGLKGSAATQMTNNNKAIVDGADLDFTNMVKSFSYIVSPVGQNEADVLPTKKP